MDNKRILIVDDNESIHEDFGKVLNMYRDADAAKFDSLDKELFGDDEVAESTDEPGVTYEIDSAVQGQQALEMVRRAHAEGRPYAMCFMDVRMPPGWDGVETIVRIWQEFPYTEMVICSAYSDYSWDEIVAKLGNTDKLLFLTKPFNAIVVKQMALSLVQKWNLGAQARDYVARLETEVSERTRQLHTLLEEVKEKNRLLEHVSLHDALTGLPNRVLFSDRLKHRLITASRENARFAAFILDLNKFKEINDTLGHQAGDQVLVEVGKRLSSVLRNSDTVARLGGDEFAILLHAVDADSHCMVAEKIGKCLEPPIMLGDKALSVGTSIGIALFPDHGQDDASLIRDADIAMYQAKRAGRGFVVYDAKEVGRQNDRQQLVHDLKWAIENDGLSLHYQPIMQIATGEVTSCEALCRWRHPERGMLSPVDFIPLAEQNGLIQPLTHWVINTALAQARRWSDQGLTLGVSINLSARNFLDPLLLSLIQDSMAKWGVEGAQITLEVTEGMTINNPERALRIMQGITELGIGLSIDDYGTGYSSLAYMKKLPVQEVKIDRMFVMDIDKDIGNQTIVRSTLDLAHALGMKVVAEGVENETELDVLRGLGCDKVQGYHLCRPKSAEDLVPWFAAR